jgi:predicted DNA-binding transcriptional regulator AlpA
MVVQQHAPSPGGTQMSARITPPPPVRLLTVRQTAEWTTWSERQVWQRLAAGDLTPIRLGRRCTRIDAAEVTALIERARAKGRA